MISMKPHQSTISRRLNAKVAVALLLIGAGTVTASAQTRPPATGADDVRTPDELITEALTLLETGDPDRAAQLIQRAGILDPALDRLKLAEGLLYMEVGRSPEALQRLEAYNETELGKRDYRGELAVGRIYKRSYNYRLASAPLKTAKSRSDGEDPELRAQIGMDYAYVLLGIDNKDDALEEAKQAGRIAPNDGKTQAAFAEVALAAREYEMALTAANRAINITLTKLDSQPFEIDSHVLLQSCYRLKSGVFDAQNDERPNDAVIFYQLAETIRQSAEVDRRISLLRAREVALQAIELNKSSADATILTAEIEADLGAFDDALIRVESVLKTQPDHPRASDLKKQFEAAIAARRGR